MAVYGKQALCVCAAAFLMGMSACEVPVARMRTTTKGYLYEGMPREELPRYGYTEERKIKSYTVGEEEYIIYDNWISPEEKDMVVVIISGGKVKGWYWKEKEEFSDLL